MEEEYKMSQEDINAEAAEMYKQYDEEELDGYIKRNLFAPEVVERIIVLRENEGVMDEQQKDQTQTSDEVEFYNNFDTTDGAVPPDYAPGHEPESMRPDPFPIDYSDIKGEQWHMDRDEKREKERNKKKGK